MSVTEKELLSLQTEELSHYWEWDNQKCSCLGKRAQAAEVAWGRGATPFWVSPAGKPETTALLNLSCKQQKQFWLLWKDENACKKKKSQCISFSISFFSWEVSQCHWQDKKDKKKEETPVIPFLPPSSCFPVAGLPFGASCNRWPHCTGDFSSMHNQHWMSTDPNPSQTWTLQGFLQCPHTNSFPISPTLSTYTTSAECWQNAYKNTPRLEQLNSITILGY